MLLLSVILPLFKNKIPLSHALNVSIIISYKPCSSRGGGDWDILLSSKFSFMQALVRYTVNLINWVVMSVTQFGTTTLQYCNNKID